MAKLLSIFVFLIFTSCQLNEPGNITPTIPKQESPKVTKVRKIKFVTSIAYEEYGVDTFSGKWASVNFSSNITARRFRSAIKRAIFSSGVNFAGHYNLARWGCGTSCQMGAITDLKTGRVYDLPSASGDYAFKKNSKLLVVNPPDSSSYYDDCSYCIPELWLWKEYEKKFERFR